MLLPSYSSIQKLFNSHSRFFIELNLQFPLPFWRSGPNLSGDQPARGSIPSYLISLNSVVLKRGLLWIIKDCSYHWGNSKGFRALCQEPERKTKHISLYATGTNWHHVPLDITHWAGHIFSSMIISAQNVYLGFNNEDTSDIRQTQIWGTSTKKLAKNPKTCQCYDWQRQRKKIKVSPTEPVQGGGEMRVIHSLLGNREFYSGKFLSGLWRLCQHQVCTP
jgi:hypothetical protein